MSRQANVLFPSSSVRDSSRFGEMISRYVEYPSTTTQWKSVFRADIPILNVNERVEELASLSRKELILRWCAANARFLASSRFHCSEALGRVWPQRVEIAHCMSD